MTPEVLAILGTLITLGLAVNAFFIKQLVDGIYAVKTALAVIETKYGFLDARVSKTEKHDNEIFKRLNEIEKAG